MSIIATVSLRVVVVPHLFFFLKLMFLFVNFLFLFCPFYKEQIPDGFVSKFK